MAVVGVEDGGGLEVFAALFQVAVAYFGESPSPTVAAGRWNQAPWPW